MFPTLARRLATSTQSATTRASNATRTIEPRTLADIVYKPKKVWPPDFTKLSQKEQFRLEKRHKRRIRLASARPRWDKFMKLAQLASITSVVTYAVLFMDIDTVNSPVHGIRSAFWNALGSFSEPRHERR